MIEESGMTRALPRKDENICCADTVRLQGRSRRYIYFQR